MPLRPGYTGPPFRFFTSFGTCPKVTEEGRRQIFLDYNFLVEQEKRRLKDENKELKEENARLRREQQMMLSSKRTRRHVDESTEALETLPKIKDPRGFFKIVADHYHVDKNTVRDIVCKAITKGKLTPEPRPGRPKQLSPKKRKAIVEVFNAKEGRGSLKRMKADLIGKTTWKTTYGPKAHTSPSTATFSRLFNEGSLVIGFVRPRPFLNEKAIAERKTFPVHALEFRDTLLVAHDEAYVQVGLKKSAFMVDLSGSPAGVEDSPQPRLWQFDGGGQAAPKIFLFGAVSKPRIVEIQGDLYIDPRFDGKVFLVRVRGRRARKRKYLEHKKGDPMFENVTINGTRYKQIFEATGGYLDAIKQYFDISERPEDYVTAKVFCIDLDREELENDNPLLAPDSRWQLPPKETEIICQEDGAPGHGFDNMHDKPTRAHDDLVYNAQTQGVKIVKQSRHSPEINPMDLGVWSILKSAVESRSCEVPTFTGRNEDAVEAKIWEIIKEEWLALSPLKLFLIFEQRRVLLQEMINKNGETIGVEPHTGLRKKWGHLRHDPDFVRQKLASSPHDVKSFEA